MTPPAGYEVSVIIPAYGPCPHLSQVVDSLLNQSVCPDEIIIGHSGADDPTERLEAKDGRVRVVHSDERMYAGEARNRAAAQASCDWIAFIDADVLPDHDWLEAFLDAARQHGENLYYAGSVGYAASGGYWGLCMWMMEFGSQHPYMPSRRVANMAGCNGFMLRQKFLEAGGFMAGAPFGEDSYFQQVLRRMGMPILFVPDARIGHFNVSGFAHFTGHLPPLGRGAAMVRASYDMPGSSAARYPFLAFALVPVRLAQMTLRVLRWGRAHRVLFFGLLPGMTLGLAIWSYHFFKEARRINRGSIRPEAS